MEKTELANIIEFDPDKISGEPVFRGTRVPIRALLENLRDGATVDQFLEWFPGVQKQQVEALLKPMTSVDIYELIERIRLKPALYLGLHSITRLDSFLDGYSLALDNLNVELVGNPDIWYFHDWVAMKLGKYESTAGWCNLLLESACGHEEKALASFFEFLDEFRQREATVLFESIPETDSKWRCEINPTTGVENPLERPALVQIVKYTEERGVFIRYVGADGNLVDREEYCSSMELAFERTDWLVQKGAWTTPDKLHTPS
ncbi:MAG: DUF433 domain-containing protein [Acidobacteria bacterium]|nr:DUF433 domain-containing protein [Acidobacteriota bacterium]